VATQQPLAIRAAAYLPILASFEAVGNSGISLVLSTTRKNVSCELAEPN
jgi:hypothetical protein